MDGNGRWAQERGRPRAFGHRAGVRAARRILRAAHRRGVQVLTLFAFSQENWKRPAAEVELLMQLFVHTLKKEVGSLHRNGVRLSFIGDHRDFPAALTAEMARATEVTRDNRNIHLVVAVGYGGQGDILRAAERIVRDGAPFTETALAERLDTADLPDPDLLIRTGGEKRISNFLLWQLAYAELYFCDVLWPDFEDEAFDTAIDWFATRQRRFGRLPEAV